MTWSQHCIPPIFSDSKFVVVEQDSSIEVWCDKHIGFFVVGGGGGGAKTGAGGSSGFFKYEIVKADRKQKQTLKISIGQGGLSSGTDGTPSTVEVDDYKMTAKGGGRNNKAGWSGGGDDGGNGYSNGGGTNGNGEQLPSLCGNVNLTFGAGGEGGEGEGGGAGGVIVNGRKPSRNSYMDGEGLPRLSWSGCGNDL